LGEEVIVSVTIDFSWRDLKTDRPLVERRSFTGHGLFLPSSAGFGERIELGRFAAVQKLAGGHRRRTSGLLVIDPGPSGRPMNE
jgi:hypothetical protein